MKVIQLAARVYKGRIAVGFLLIALSIGACTSNPIDHYVEISARTRTMAQSPVEMTGSPIWLPNQTVIVTGYTAEARLSIYDARLWQRTLGDEKLAPIDLPDYPNCVRSGFFSPSRLPDGRLGYVLQCRLPEDQFKSQAEWIREGSRLHMMAYDPETGQVEELLNTPMQSALVGTGGFSWNPQMTRGIMGVDSRILFEQLSWFTPDEWTKVDLGFAQAYGGAWSPDGATIAFLGAEEQGRDGIARLDSRFDLYLMDGVGEKYLMDGVGENLRLLAEDIVGASGLDWSPDGRWIVTDGRFTRFSHPDGIWLIDVLTGARYLIGGGRYSGPTWSPDGRRIVALDYSQWNPDTPPSGIIVIEPNFDSLDPANGE